MRPKTLKLFALNIVAHPHEGPATYITLFSRAAKERISERMHGSRSGMIGSFSKTRKSMWKDSVDWYDGFISTYTDFDPNAPWINKDTGEHADEDDLLEVKVPPHLRPDAHKIHFMFHPQSHRLIYEGEISPSTVRKLIQNILQKAAGSEQFIDVTVEQSHEGLRQIIDNAHLRHITITFKRPNSDMFSDLDMMVENEMDSMNAREKKISLSHIPGHSLRLDKKHKALAKVAKSNGSVEARAVGEHGRMVTLKTSDHPAVHNDPVAEGEDYFDAFLRSARNFLITLLS